MPVWKLKDGIRLGKVLKPYGYLGFVRVAFFVSGLEDVLVEEGFVFIEWTGKPVPYRIIELIWDDAKTARLRFADVETLGDASKLTGRHVILSEKEVPKYILKSLEPNELIGFQVIDSQKKALGIVTGLNEAGPQSILEVNLNGNEFMIPFHEDLIKKTDLKKRTILVDLPDGLMDI